MRLSDAFLTQSVYNHYASAPHLYKLGRIGINSLNVKVSSPRVHSRDMMLLPLVTYHLKNSHYNPPAIDIPLHNVIANQA